MSFVGDAFDAITGQGAQDAADAQVQSGQQAMELQRDMYDQSRQDLAPFRLTGTNALYNLADLYGVSRPQSMFPSADPSVEQGGQQAGQQTTTQVGGDSVTAGNRGVGSIEDWLSRNQQQATATTQQPQGGEQQPAVQYTDPSQAQDQAFQNFRTSPGYEFRLDQGREAIERSNAASGMLNSGATLQDLEQFGQGIASQEYQNYTNRLASLAGIGQTTSSQQAQNALATGGQLADMQTGIGNARASGYVGQGNAIRSLLGQGAQAAGAAGGFGALFSDRRLKRDIARVGALDSGIPVYHFRYNWSDDWYEGVMADEVEPVIPEAVTEIDGYKAVDYAKVH